jgi:molybdenum cofactor synthesis domain-containing protein
MTVADEEKAIRDGLERSCKADFVLTTGGTGIGPRDVTPEATRGFCTRELPGIAEMLRATSYQETPMATLSRAAAGQRGRTIVVNLPGSPAGVRTCVNALLPIMEHAVAMMRGEGHP